MINTTIFLQKESKDSIGVADNTIVLKPKLNRSTDVKCMFKLNRIHG
jgi:hypothetical protein